jgi:hypothetical protein
MGGRIRYTAKLDPPEDIPACNDRSSCRRAPDLYKASFMARASARFYTSGAACFRGYHLCPWPSTERG